MKENLLIDKSIAFATRIVKLHQHLIKNKKETLFQHNIYRITHFDKRKQQIGELLK